jgi:hypothetical protein
MVFVFLNIRLSDLVISAAMQRVRGRKRYAKKFGVGRFMRRTEMCLLLEQMPDRCARRGNVLSVLPPRSDEPNAGRNQEDGDEKHGRGGGDRFGKVAQGIHPATLTEAES